VLILDCSKQIVNYFEQTKFFVADCPVRLSMDHLQAVEPVIAPVMIWKSCPPVDIPVDV
jgi:hypothetical protein